LADQAERLQAASNSATLDTPQVSRIQGVLSALQADEQTRMELAQAIATAVASEERVISGTS